MSGLLRGSPSRHGTARLGTVSAEGDVMGKEARVALILAAAACLMAVAVEWAIGELNGEPQKR
jgi:hypothetical protein